MHKYNKWPLTAVEVNGRLDLYAAAAAAVLCSVWPRSGSHLGLRSRLDLAPERLESRLSHHLMTRLDLKFS